MKYLLIGLLLASCGKNGKNGRNGVDGKDGKDGANGHSLVSLINPASEIECTSGGQRLDVYLDMNDSFTADEFDLYLNSVVSCNGTDGQDGVDGQDGIDGQDGADGRDGERAAFIAERFFEAGAKYGRAEMQNAYETLNAHDEMLIATVDKLKEDNTKLVEALKIGVEAGEFFARHADCKRDSWSCKCSFCKDTNSSSNLRKVRQVLKEIGKE